MSPIPSKKCTPINLTDPRRLRTAWLPVEAGVAGSWCGAPCGCLSSPPPLNSLSKKPTCVSPCGCLSSLANYWPFSRVPLVSIQPNPSNQTNTNVPDVPRPNLRHAHSSYQNQADFKSHQKNHKCPNVPCPNPNCIRPPYQATFKPQSKKSQMSQVPMSPSQFHSHTISITATIVTTKKIANVPSPECPRTPISLDTGPQITYNITQRPQRKFKQHP